MTIRISFALPLHISGLYRCSRAKDRVHPHCSCMQDQERFGETVRKLRMAKGWSQDVFADRSGLHRADIGAIERGERNVTLRTIRTIADTLGVKIADLLSGM